MTGKAKTIVNKTQTPIEVNLYIRLGSDNIDLNYTTLIAEVNSGETYTIDLPEDANLGNLPFLNGIDVLTSDYKHCAMIVDNKSDSTDDLLNKNHTFKIMILEGKINIEGKN